MKNGKRGIKRLLVMLLSLSMVMCNIPVTAMAETAEDEAAVIVDAELVQEYIPGESEDDEIEPEGEEVDGNIFVLADDVKQICEDEGTLCHIDDNCVIFRDLTVNLEIGDRFSFYYLEMPCVYTVLGITSEGNETTICISELESDALEYVDASGEVSLFEMEYSQIDVVFAEGLKAELEIGEDYKVSYDKDKRSIEVEVPGFAATISNMVFTYDVDSERNTNIVLLDADYKLEVKADLGDNAKFVDKEFKLCEFRFYGIGIVRLTLKLEAGFNEITYETSGHFQIGQNNGANIHRITKENNVLNKEKLSAEFEAKASLIVEVGVDALVASITVYAGLKAKASIEFAAQRINLQDGSGNTYAADCACIELKLGLVLTAGLKGKVLVGKFDLEFGEIPCVENSFHWEKIEGGSMQLVNYCRGDHDFGHLTDGEEAYKDEFEVFDFNGTEHFVEFPMRLNEYTVIALMGDAESNENDNPNRALTIISGGIDTNGYGLTIDGDLYIEGGILDIQKGSFVWVTGNVYQSGGSINIGDGTLEIGGDYLIAERTVDKESNKTLVSSCDGTLSICGVDAMLLVKGNFITYSSGRNYLQNGTVKMCGNVKQLGRYQNFRMEIGITLYYSGVGYQHIYYEYPEGNSYAQNPVYENSMENILYGNGMPGFTMSDDMTLVGSLGKGEIDGGYALNIVGELNTNGHQLTIKNNLYLSSDSHIVVEGLKNSGGLSVEGNIYQRGGELRLIGGTDRATVTVGKSIHISSGYLEIGNAYVTTNDLIIAVETFDEAGNVSYGDGNGYFVMNRAGALLNIAGDFVIATTVNRSAPNYGKIIFRGDMRQLNETANFYFGPMLTLEFAGEGDQTIYFEDTEYSGFCVNPIFTNAIENIYIPNGMRGWKLSDDLTLINEMGPYRLDIDVEMNTNGHKLTIVGDYLLDDENIITDNDGMTGNKGSFSVTGNLEQTGGQLTIREGEVNIGGDYAIATKDGQVLLPSDGVLLLTDASAKLTVNGDFTTYSKHGDYATISSINVDEHLNSFANGQIVFCGNVTQKGKYTNLFFNSKMRICLAGEAAQRIWFDNPSICGFSSTPIYNNKVENITYPNGLKGFTLTDDFEVLASKGDYQLDFVTDVDTAGYMLKLRGDYCIDGESILVNGKQDESGKVVAPGGCEIQGNLVQTDGRLMVYDGELLITGDYIIAGIENGKYLPSDGSVSLCTEQSVIQINGDFITYSSKSPRSEYGYESGHNLFKLGTIIFKGDVQQLGENYSNLVFQATLKVYFGGSGKQNIYFDNILGCGFNANPIFDNDPSNVMFPKGLKGWTLTDDFELLGMQGDYQLVLNSVFHTNGYKLTIIGDLNITEENFKLCICNREGVEEQITGAVEIQGSLYQRTGVVLNDGTLIIRDDYQLVGVNEDGTITSTYASLSLMSSESMLEIGRDLIWYSLAPSYYNYNTYAPFGLNRLTKGEIRINGNISILPTTATSFAPDTELRVVLSGNHKQVICVEGYNNLGNLELLGNTANYEFVTGKCWNRLTVHDYHANGYNISLDGDIALNYYILLNEEDVDSVSLSMQAGNKVVVTDNGIYDENTGAYRFTINLPAALMNEKVKSILYIGDKEYAQTELSVADYARALLSDESQEAVHDIVRAMLNYGGYAQVYFGYRTDQLANENLYSKDNDPVNGRLEDIPLLDYSNSENGISLLGTSLLCSNKLGFRLYLEGPTENVDYEVKVYSAEHGYAVFHPTIRVVDGAESVVMVSVENLSPLYFMDVFYIQVMENNSGKNAAIYASPSTYINSAQMESRQELAELTRAIYYYVQSIREME